MQALSKEEAKLFIENLQKECQKYIDQKDHWYENVRVVEKIIENMLADLYRKGKRITWGEHLYLVRGTVGFDDPNTYQIQWVPEVIKMCRYPKPLDCISLGKYKEYDLWLCKDTYEIIVQKEGKDWIYDVRQHTVGYWLDQEPQIKEAINMAAALNYKLPFKTGDAKWRFESIATLV